jgi:hypothetical protein
MCGLKLKLSGKVVVLSRCHGVCVIGLSDSVGARGTGKCCAVLSTEVMLTALVFALLMLVGRILLTCRTCV